MLALPFPGSDRLVASLDHAVHRDHPDDIADALCATMCELIDDPSVRLPPCVLDASSDHYCRRELYRSESLGYSVIAMTWGPKQGTPIHDHSGMWCVEGVWHGALEITTYDLIERDAASERCRFQSRGTLNVGPGSTGSLIPPREYHTIHNPSATDVAVTLHVYRGPMTQCSIFRPLDAAGWYRRDQRALSLDAVH